MYLQVTNMIKNVIYIIYHLILYTFLCCVDGYNVNNLILKWMLNKCGVIIWSGFIWLNIGPVVICRECGNELSVYVRGGIS
jgi:hypothetical protein